MFALITLLSTLSVECPATINTEQQILTAPSGWQAMVRDPAGQPTRQTTHYLDGLTLFDGEPGELASLKPDNGDADDTPRPPITGAGCRAPASIWSATIGAQPPPCSSHCQPI